MLERDGALATWRLLALPAPWCDSAESTHQAEANRLPDHRLEFLDYEGLLTGGRGSVRRKAGGELRWIRCEAERIEVELHGEGALGLLAQLCKVVNSPNSDRWLLSLSSLPAGETPT
jgi:hypothetical protein